MARIDWNSTSQISPEVAVKTLQLGMQFGADPSHMRSQLKSDLFTKDQLADMLVESLKMFHSAQVARRS